MRLDRPTLLAALVTAAAATPVYLVIAACTEGAGPAIADVLAWSAQSTVAEPAADAEPGVASAPPPVAAPAPATPVAEVKGTLRTRDGTPVPDETVELSSWAQGTGYYGMSDPRGRFTIRDVALGSDYEAKTSSEGRYRDASRRGLAVKPEGLTLDLVLEPLAHARLAGRMVDTDGTPIPLRTLILQASHAPGQSLHVTGDERGFFRIDDAPTGQLTFTTQTIPHIQVRGPLLRPASEVDVVLVLDQGGLELRGRIVGERDVPVAGAQLKLSWLYKSGDAISSSARTAVTDPEGGFHFEDLGSGSHQLAVYAEGYEEARETYSVSWNSPDVELQLRPAFR